MAQHDFQDELAVSDFCLDFCNSNPVSEIVNENFSTSIRLYRPCLVEVQSSDDSNTSQVLSEHEISELEIRNPEYRSVRLRQKYYYLTSIQHSIQKATKKEKSRSIPSQSSVLSNNQRF